MYFGFVISQGQTLSLMALLSLHKVLFAAFCCTSEIIGDLRTLVLELLLMLDPNYSQFLNDPDSKLRISSISISANACLAVLLLLLLQFFHHKAFLYTELRWLSFS